MELTSFLNGGEPPVCIGFSSITGAGPAATARLVLDAVRSAGTRAVLLTGWGGMRDVVTSEDVLVLDQAPHSWLFPRVAAVVHHGGAGTTAAALRAGTPSVVVPHGVDQPYWGARVAALGAGPRPVPRSALTSASLAAALRTALGDQGIRGRAAELGARIREEDGVAAAVEFLGRR